jgi:hypothetical protein
MAGICDVTCISSLLVPYAARTFHRWPARLLRAERNCRAGPDTVPTSRQQRIDWRVPKQRTQVERKIFSLKYAMEIVLVRVDMQRINTDVFSLLTLDELRIGVFMRPILP